MLQGHNVGPERGCGTGCAALTQQGRKLFARLWCSVYDHLHQLWIHHYSCRARFIPHNCFIAVLLHGVQGVISRR